MSLTNKVAQFDADSDLVNAWVHGPATGAGSTITTDSGAVRTPAKLIADNEAEIQAVINATSNWANGPTTGTNSTVTLGGVAVRSPAKLIADLDASINVAAVGPLTAAGVSASAAAASAALAQGYLTAYRATSYGALASDPTLDPNGGAPTAGDEYFNTTSNLLKRFNGAAWQVPDINTTNLAAPSGASLVGYMPEGVGAAASNAQSKFRESISVRASGGDDTLQIEVAISAAISAGIKHVLLVDAIYRCNINLPSNVHVYSRNGSVLTAFNTALATVAVNQSGALAYDPRMSNIAIKNTGAGGGMTLKGREGKFTNVRIEDCNTFGLKLINSPSGSALNRFIGCDFYRNGGGGVADSANVIIPANDAGGYANGTMFVSCWFDRFGDNVPCLDLGTSAHLASCWIQGRSYAGIKLRGDGVRLRLAACSVDSTSSDHVLIECVDGALPQYINSASSTVDGKLAVGGNIYSAASVVGGLTTSLEGASLVRAFYTGDESVRMDVNKALRIKGTTPNITSGETYADLQFYNTDTSAAAPNVAARIKATSNTSTGAGGRIVFCTSLGTELEGIDAPDVVQIDGTGNLHPVTDNLVSLGTSALRWVTVFANKFALGSGTAAWSSGSGSPEGVVSASRGSLYSRVDGGTSTTLYVKETGTGTTTGWVAK
jgi:hypothetical protein